MLQSPSASTSCDTQPNTRVQRQMNTYADHNNLMLMRHDVYSMIQKRKKTLRTSPHSDVYQRLLARSHAEDSVASQGRVVVGLWDTSHLSSDSKTPSFVTQTAVRLSLDLQWHWNTRRNILHRHLHCNFCTERNRLFIKRQICPKYQRPMLYALQRTRNYSSST